MSTDTNKAPSKVKPIGLKLPGDFETSAHGHTLNAEQLASMPPEGVAYLLKVGFTGSITDAAAMGKDKKAELGSTYDAKVKEKRAGRFADILSGEVSHGGSTGARATPIERFAIDVAKERIKALAASRGVPMPKKDVLKAAIDKLLADSVQGPDIRAEAEARMASASKAGEAIADLMLG